MSKVYVDEIQAASDLYKGDIFSSDTNTVKSIDGQIGEFISTSSNTLKGDMWDAVRTKMQEFQDVFQKQASLVDEFGSAIQQALKLLYDCVGDNVDYDFLDTDQLEELNNKKSVLQAKLDNLNKGEQKQTGYETVNGQQVPKYETVYDNAAIESTKSELADVEKLIAKTEEFKVVYNEAVSILDAAFSKVQAFASVVNSVQVSKKATYNV